MQRSPYSISFFRNFIFGVEDSLVSTVGLLSGIALATVPGETIFITGVVLVLVEAFSMSAGSFLSESSAEEYANKAEQPKKHNVLAALVMFGSYFISGFIPLFPYVFWPVDVALKISIVASIIALFVLGAISATLSHTSILKSGLRMVIIGGIAIAMGAIAGAFISQF